MATASYKCPSCGGGLQFRPDIQKLKCEFCLNEYTNEELARLSQAFEEKTGKPEEAGAEVLKGYVCDSCGAEVVTEATTSATFCYYCHNPVLLTGRLSGDFKPTRIIPFAYDKDRAIKTFLAWAGRRKFVPKEFYSTSQLEKITGVYIPYWMADVAADVDYAGKGVNLRTWRVGSTEYTEHKEYDIQRQGVINVNNVHEIANRKIDKALIDSISPYDETQAVEFSMPYLSGFFAEKYDIDRETVQPVIETKARDCTKIMLQETLGSYQQLNLERQRLDISIKGWNYALLPAWILTYLYKGKTYVYAINGQNGKTHGELPVDNKKLGLTSGLIAAALFALVIIGGLLIW